MCSNNKKKIWRERFGKILKYTFHIYKINYIDFAKENKINDATVRYWFEGRNFPCEYSWNLLTDFLKMTLTDSPQNNSIIHQYISSTLGEEYKNELSAFKRQHRNISLFIIEVLSFCKNCGKDSIFDIRRENDFKQTSKTRVVVFDFEGTISSDKSTAWERIWIELGFKSEDFSALQMKLNRNEISLQEWTKIISTKFGENNLIRTTFDKISQKISVLCGTKELFEELNKRNIKIYVVSGSVLPAIKIALKDCLYFIDGIFANDILFDENGTFVRVINTIYDYKGKANFLVEISEKLSISTKDMLYVGDSVNDQDAYLSGVKTLCINPHITDISDTTVWNKCIGDCKDLKDILNYI